MLPGPRTAWDQVTQPRPSRHPSPHDKRPQLIASSKERTPGAATHEKLALPPGDGFFLSCVTCVRVQRVPIDNQKGNGCNGLFRFHVDDYLLDRLESTSPPSPSMTVCPSLPLLTYTLKEERAGRQRIIPRCLVRGARGGIDGADSAEKAPPYKGNFRSSVPWSAVRNSHPHPSPVLFASARSGATDAMPCQRGSSSGELVLEEMQSTHSRTAYLTCIRTARFLARSLLLHPLVAPSATLRI